MLIIKRFDKVQYNARLNERKFPILYGQHVEQHMVNM